MGWAARLPFYLLQTSIAPAVLGLRRRDEVAVGAAVGGWLAVQLALWSLATRCPPVVPVVYLASGVAQGAGLALLKRWWTKSGATTT